MNHCFARNKLFEIVLIYILIALFLSGCGAWQPVAAPLINGEVANLFQGTARWMATASGVEMFNYVNASTGITVYTRPIADGWAIACGETGSCDDVVAYLVNFATYKAFTEWLVSQGYTLVKTIQVPAGPMPTILVMPVFMMEAAYFSAQACSLGIGMEDEMGNCVGTNPAIFTPDDSDGFSDESDYWSEVP